MKQLDGLKSSPTARVAVRKFLSEGLEAMGPAGACMRVFGECACVLGGDGGSRVHTCDMGVWSRSQFQQIGS